MQIPTTLWSHAPLLAVVLVVSGLLIRYFPSIVVIITKDPQRRRAALEVLRLRRKDASKLPTYLVADDPPVVKPPKGKKTLPKPGSE